MRVDPSTAQSSIALAQTDASTNRTANRAAATSGSAPETGAFSMTDQLSQLLASVRNAPEVRPEAVASALKKMASGELDSSQAATETASALLADAVDPTP